MAGSPSSQAIIFSTFYKVRTWHGMFVVSIPCNAHWDSNHCQKKKSRKKLISLGVLFSTFSKSVPNTAGTVSVIQGKVPVLFFFNFRLYYTLIVALNGCTFVYITIVETAVCV